MFLKVADEVNEAPTAKSIVNYGDNQVGRGDGIWHGAQCILEIIVKTGKAVERTLAWANNDYEASTGLCQREDQTRKDSFLRSSGQCYAERALNPY